MAEKPKSGKGGSPARTLNVQVNQGEDAAHAEARTFLRPTIHSGATILAITEKAYGQKLDLGSLLDELSAQCALVAKGDMGRPEAVLTTQMHTLDALFNNLTQIAYRNFNNLDVCERVLRLALKAQGQTRATVETLAAIKNPPMVFAKQANVTSGPQQVNNEFRDQYAPAPARKSESFEQNKLLEKSDGKRLDPITSGGAVSSDPAVATVGAIDRAANG